MEEVALKVLNILGILSIPSIGWGIYLYCQNRKLRRWDAEKELAKQDIEFGRMDARHRREENEILADCEGEIRVRDNISVNTLTVEDNKRLAELHEEQRRERDELFAEITYLQRLLGQDPGSLIGKENIWKRMKRKVRRNLLVIKK